jgi:hypothetical protein
MRHPVVRDSFHRFRLILVPTIHFHPPMMRTFSPAFLAWMVLVTTHVSVNAVVVRVDAGECRFLAHGLVCSLRLCLDLHVRCGSQESTTTNAVSSATLETWCRGL